VVVEGHTVRSVLKNLETVYPDVTGQLCRGDGLRPGVAVAVDGNMSSQSLLQKVSERSEVHFVAAIGGG
jgi:sulfur carrier protein ThiS